MVLLLYGNSALRSDSWSINTFMPTSWSKFVRENVSICKHLPSFSNFTSSLCTVCQITCLVQFAEPGKALSTVGMLSEWPMLIHVYMHLCHWLSPLAIFSCAVLSMFISSWWLSPVLHSLVGSLLWLAYAWDHMNHIDLRNSSWIIRFHCRVTAMGIFTQPRVIPDVIFVLIGRQSLTSMN
jgi:hypothetical protein